MLCFTSITLLKEDAFQLHGDWLHNCKVVRSFVKACILSLVLVKEANDELYWLELYVVRQYFVTVCLRFRQWAEKRVQQVKGLGAEVKQLDEALESLRRELRRFWSAEELSIAQASLVASNWLVMTIIHPVFAALASTFVLSEIGPDEKRSAFAKHVKRHDTGTKWAKETEPLRPSVVVMSFSSCIVGTSAARWRLAKARPSQAESPFERQERMTRAAGMDHRTQRVLKTAREAQWLFSVHSETNNGLEWPERERAAREAVVRELGMPQDALLHDHPEEKWLTLRSATLLPCSQCASCRIKYPSVEQVVPNSSVPSDQQSLRSELESALQLMR